MKQNEEFLKSIDKNLFVYGGSYAIKKQVKWFRDFNDIDIMGFEKNLDYFQFKANNLNLKFENWKNKYWTLEINKIIFEDKSSIDIINNVANKIILIDNNFYLDINEIMKYKMDLLFNDIDKNLNRNNKHLLDLMFLISKWYSFTYNKKVDYRDLLPLPFKL